MKKYVENGIELRKLRIKAGFKSMNDAAQFTGTNYVTWKSWELGISNPLEIVWKYLDLFIKTKQNPYP